MNYFQYTFEQMETQKLQKWLRDAQIKLPETRGMISYSIMEEGIKGAAAELLNRYRSIKD